MKEFFKNRTAGSFVGLFAAVLAIVTALALLIYGQSVGDFLPAAFLLLLAGAVCAGAAWATGLPFLPIAPGVCYVLAFGLYLKRELMTMSNYFNQIAIGNSGSSFQMIITFLGLMMAAAVLATVSSCFRQKKA
ncbi:hypothetical protein [Pseudoflavonifractor intestinihominis]|uniref:Uncharacterized protein n=1 Tax=Pseudoflavonifractor intestinihominis TaxID=3133171 RepID=A0ABV1E6C0_9FIRM|nr:hypothetical protein [uncultured Pseudoflavonifractor sp.]